MLLMYSSIHNIKLTRTNPFFYLFNPICPSIPNLPKTLTLMLEMVTQSESSKRPVCSSCSKPTRVCLCTRFKTPKIQNSIAITILQHSLEKKHPLNSTRIASLGLENVDVVSVSDVSFQAWFRVQVLDPGPGCVNFDEKMGDFCELEDSIFTSGSGDDCNSREFEKYPAEKMSYFVDFNGEFRKNCEFDSGKMGEKSMDNDGLGSSSDVNLYEKECFVRDSDVKLGYSCCRLDEGMVDRKVRVRFDADGVVSGDLEGADIVFDIEKYGVIRLFCHRWGVLGQQQKLDFEKFLGCRVAMDDLAKGFLVKKLQRKPLNGGFEYEEFEEFEIIVPRGTVLLFPSENAVGIEDIDFEVKNLILLDGTWSKAKRMYNENPWLKALPHLKLDIDKLSLYAEVRHQPKAGFLSTIESIVYALKAIGDDHSKELDGLLDVFDSMVGDQRRCKDERLSKA